MAINKKDILLFSEREKGEGEERGKKNQKVNAGTLPSLQAGQYMGVPPDGRLPGILPTYWPCWGHRGLTSCPSGTVRQYKHLKKA